MRLRRQNAIRLMPNAARDLRPRCQTHTQYEVIIDKVDRDRFGRDH